jgi:hypothetical protein
MEGVGGGVCVTFGGERSADAAANIRARWLERRACETATPLDRGKFERFLERASAAELARFWEKL